MHELSTTLMYVQVSSNTVMNCTNNVNTVTIKICYAQSVIGSMLLLKRCQCETVLNDKIHNTQAKNTLMHLVVSATLQNMPNKTIKDLSVLLR